MDGWMGCWCWCSQRIEETGKRTSALDWPEASGGSSISGKVFPISREKRNRETEIEREQSVSDRQKKKLGGNRISPSLSHRPD